jgi:hypothetical protein
MHAPDHGISRLAHEGGDLAGRLAGVPKFAQLRVFLWRPVDLESQWRYV